MKRRAIIIGAPLYRGNDPFSAGVKNDMIDYYNFFTSATGGAYYEEEIVFLENPSLNELKTLKRTFKDFSVIAFSGHGSHNIFNNESILTINKSETISISELVKSVYSPRQLIIVDSCRNFVSLGGQHNFIGDIETGIHFPSNINFQTARNIYDNYLRQTSFGAQVIYSCAPGEFSRATYEGSYFSKSLLQSVKNWSSVIENKSILTTSGAFRFASNRLSRITNKQHPGLVTTNKVSKNFPFAIRLGTELLYQQLL